MLFSLVTVVALALTTTADDIDSIATSASHRDTSASHRDTSASHRDARALLDRWLDAQNRGDFVAYQALYDPQFTGVRRSGSKTAPLDRAAWMTERARMFEKKMVVEANAVRVFANGVSARVVFSQRWSSGSYSDVGSKQLLLRRGPAGVHIFREELFDSSKQSSGVFDPAAFQRFAFVIDGEIVVSLNPSEAWAQGRSHLDSAPSDMIHRVRQAIRPGALPPEVARLAGGRVFLFDGRGKRCEAKIGPFHLRRRFLAHPEEIADVEIQDGSYDVIAQPMLVAVVDGDRKACAGATWARSADQSPPAIAPAIRPSQLIAERALAAFRRLPQSRAIQRVFSDWSGKVEGGTRSKVWYRAGDDRPVISEMRVAGAATALVSVSASIWLGDCGSGMSAVLWALWQVEGPPDAPRLVLRNQPDGQLSLEPTAAVDLDGDGTAEILFRRFSDGSMRNASGNPEWMELGLVRALGDAYVDFRGVTLPNMMCPC